MRLSALNPLLLLFLAALPQSLAGPGGRSPCAAQLVDDEAAGPAGLVDPTYESWQRLRNPLRGSRPRGITVLRQEAAKGELVTVVAGRGPVDPTLRQHLELMYGTKVVYAAEVAPGTVTTSGVALHPDQTPDLANAYRARLNPHLGWGHLHGELNKWQENVFARGVDPNSAPDTVRSTDLAEFFGTEQRRAEIGRAIESGSLSAGQRAEVGAAVEKFFAAVKAKYPQGAFIKHVAEFATKDHNGQITSGADPTAIFKEGLERLLRLRGRFAKKGVALTDKEAQVAVHESSSAAARFLNGLIFEPETVLAQGKLDIALSPLGHPLEFRVDFIDGEAVRATMRHSSEFMPDEAEIAKKFLTEFFARAPERYRYLSGGADVMFLKDGSQRFIEFNFGAESEFINASAGYPVLPNDFVAQLSGKPTPLLQKIIDVADRPVDEQAETLLGLDHLIKSKKWGDYSAVSIEAFHYLRDYKLRAWAAHPSKEGATRLVDELTALARKMGPAYGDAEDAKVLIEFVEEIQPFISAKLGV